MNESTIKSIPICTECGLNVVIENVPLDARCFILDFKTKASTCWKAQSTKIVRLSKPCQKHTIINWPGRFIDEIRSSCTRRDLELRLEFFLQLNSGAPIFVGGFNYYPNNLKTSLASRK